LKAKLLQYRELPPNGLALFCGVYVDQEGKEHKIMAEIPPVRPLSHSLYKCDNRFHTEAIRSQLADDTRYGFIVIDGSCASFHLLIGDTKETIFKKEVQLPKKHGRGGQSQNRFARIREEKRDWYTSDIAEITTKHFIDLETNKVNVRHLIVSGSASLKNELIKKLDPRIQKAIVRTYDVQYSGEMGFQATLSLCQEELLNCRYIQEKALVSKFFSAIAEDSKLYAYSPEQSIYALEAGAVDTLIVWSELPTMRYVLSNSGPQDETSAITTPRVVFALPESVDSVLAKINESVESGVRGWEISSSQPLLDWLLENYLDFGSDLQVIAGNSSLSAQFVEGFGGVGALLRYPLETPASGPVEDEEEEYSYDY